MLCCIAADSQCSSISSSTRLADPDSRPCGQQGRLLHFCTRRHHWSPNGQGTVRSECRCSVGLLSQEIRAHNSSASRAPLAASPRAYSVPVVRPCPSLSPQLSSGIPCREPPSDHRSECPSLSAVAIHTAFDPRRSGIACGCVQGLEQSAQLNEKHRVLAKFSPGTKNIALLVVVWLNCYRQSLIFILDNCPVVRHRAVIYNCPVVRHRAVIYNCPVVRHCDIDDFVKCSGSVSVIVSF